MDKIDAYKRYKFDIMFVGDDWYESKKWKEIDDDFKDLNIRVVYFPYTKTTSSTLINQTLENLRKVKECD